MNTINDALRMPRRLLYSWSNHGHPWRTLLRFSLMNTQNACRLRRCGAR
jgi:hypothetical protein